MTVSQWRRIDRLGEIEHIFVDHFLDAAGCFLPCLNGLLSIIHFQFRLLITQINLVSYPLNSQAKTYSEDIVGLITKKFPRRADISTASPLSDAEADCTNSILTLQTAFFQKMHNKYSSFSRQSQKICTILT